MTAACFQAPWTLLSQNHGNAEYKTLAFREARFEKLEIEKLNFEAGSSILKLLKIEAWKLHFRASGLSQEAPKWSFRKLQNEASRSSKMELPEASKWSFQKLHFGASGFILSLWNLFVVAWKQAACLSFSIKSWLLHKLFKLAMWKVWFKKLLQALKPFQAERSLAKLFLLPSFFQASHLSPFQAPSFSAIGPSQQQFLCFIAWTWCWPSPPKP